MDCAADDGASFDEQAKMSMFAITLGSDIWDRLGDYESIEPYSGGACLDPLLIYLVAPCRVDLT